MEMHFSLKHSGLCQGQGTGLDRLWLWCRMAALLLSCQISLHKESWWDKQVSLGNALPPAKVILHLGEVHYSISVSQACLFPTERDVFSKLYKTAILQRRIHRDLSSFRAVWSQNALGRDFSIQGDAACKGRQWFLTLLQTLPSREMLISWTCIFQRAIFGNLWLQQHTEARAKSGF